LGGGMGGSTRLVALNPTSPPLARAQPCPSRPSLAQSRGDGLGWTTGVIAMLQEKADALNAEKAVREERIMVRGSECWEKRGRAGGAVEAAYAPATLYVLWRVDHHPPSPCHWPHLLPLPLPPPPPQIIGQQITALWKRLATAEEEQTAFLESHAGIGDEVIAAVSGD
jgi:hypothetical protein